jgi:hypothetical protein
VNLSNDLVTQFVKATAKDNRKASAESIVYGTTVVYDGKTYVKLDGSDLLTPVTTTTDVKSDERVTVMIKDHTATITGNISSPAARTDDVKEVANQITEFEIIVAHKVSAEELEAAYATIEALRAKLVNIDEMHAIFADIESLEARFADVEYLKANDIQAINANIEKIQAHFGSFTDLSAAELEALNAEIQTLKGHTADFTYVSADVLDALKAQIKNLDAEHLDANYANIDFSNIGEAAVEKLFAESGIIRNIIVSGGKITGELVGVTIKGDLIEAGTLKADKLVVKGSDGIYYKLNVEAGAVESAEVTKEELQTGLHGTAIIAKTITAEKIAVDDLVAFDATIGGFNITDKALYSGVKETATNTTRGVYLDKEGQFSAGDANDYLRYYKTEDGKYKLEIAASSLVFSTNGKNVKEFIEERTNIGSRNLLRNSKTLIFDKYYFEYGSPSAVLGTGTLGSMKLGQE